MKTILFICMSLGCWTIAAQIKFQKIIHDHGLITEDGVPVSHKFVFDNLFQDQVELISVQPSCGCTLADIESTIVKGKSQSWIKLTYDPKNRPGYFLKPAQVVFKHNGDTISASIAVKGFSLSKDNQLLTNSDYVEDYHLEIAPFNHSVRYIDKWNTDKNVHFSAFIDDISYIIDQFGFVEINLDIIRPNLNNKEAFATELSHLKKTIREALEIRNYVGFSVAFKDSIRVLPSQMEAEEQVQFIMYPKNFVNHKLETSLIFDKNIVNLKPNIPPLGVHRGMIHYQDLKPEKKFHQQENYNVFIKQCVRNSLSRQELWIRVYNFNIVYRHKHVKKIVKRIVKDLDRQGIEKEIINIDKASDDGLNLNICRLAEILPIVPDSIKSKNNIIADTINIFEQYSSNGSSNQTGTIQKLPAYFQQLKQFVNRIDTTNKFFIAMMETVVDEIKEGKRIAFVMESSASKAPSQIKEDNYYVARLRADKSKEIIAAYLINKGLLPSDIIFKETLPLVSGPEYDPLKYLPQYYFYFQYLKVIPLYANNSKTSFISPYKINFNYNNLDVLNKSKIFQNFLNQLAQEIQTKGYVKLIIESSSSKVPTTKMSKNQHLSYHRAQEAKNQIYQGIQERGFNPTKVIFVEERILVQGPEYKDDYKENAEVYQQFQYIKILPYNQLIED